MKPYLFALLICAGIASVEGLCAGREPMAKLRALRQPAWSPAPWVWVVIGLFWYGICYAALVRLLPAFDERRTIIGLLIALMLGNAFANVPQFRMVRLDIAFFYLFPYWLLLAMFLVAVRDVDRLVFGLFAVYTGYQPYAAVWAWRLWQLNRAPPD